MYGLHDGGYQVTFPSSSDNTTIFQQFDLMDCCLFTRQLKNLSTPATFTIPEGNVLNSPFIAKATKGKELASRFYK